MENFNKDYEYRQVGLASLAIILIIAGVLVLVGTGYYLYQSLNSKSQNNVPQIIGGDKDSGGCLIGAGYSWCEVKQKCIRIWEEKCEIPTAAAQYNCKDGKTIQAEFYKGTPVSSTPGQPPVPTGSVSLKLSDGRNMLVPQTISGSGVRYANQDESFIFWNKGDTAFIEENNTQTYYSCVVGS